MKVTHTLASYMPLANDHSSVPKNSLPQGKNKQHLANQYAAERTDQQWRTTQLSSWGRWGSDQLGLAPAHKYASELSSLTTVKEPHFSNSNTDRQSLTVSPASENTSNVPVHAPALLYSESPDIWLFCPTTQKLGNNTTCIQLTTIESLLIKTLTLRDERICSKQELIVGINKDAYSYSGLEMCLSRLQSKFRMAFGERLFRSVRNRGYCLVQDVRITV